MVTNVELDHHATFASTAELEERFERWAAGPGPGGWSGGATSTRSTSSSSVPGEHNRLNAACALAALELAGFDREAAAKVLHGFRGAGRRLEEHGEAGGVAAGRRLRPPSGRARGGDRGRAQRPRRRGECSSSSSRTSTRGRSTSARARRGARRRRCRSRHRDLRGARGAGPGISGKLVVDRLADVRPGMPIGWAPALPDAARLAASFARPGGVLLTAGAGNVDSALPLIREALGRVNEQVPLSRYTTLGTGGPARWFDQPETVDALVERLAWAAGERPPGRRRRARLEPARRGRRVPWGRPQARGIAGRRRGWRGDARRGRRRPARRLPPPRPRRRAGRDGVRLRHPRHGRRGGLDERGRLRRRHVGSPPPRPRRRRRRRRVEDSRGARAPLPRAPACVTARWSPPPSSAWSRGRWPRSRRRSRTCRRGGRPPSRQTSGRSEACSRTPSTS